MVLPKSFFYGFQSQMEISFGKKHPQIHSSVFIASTAVVIGDVILGEGSSVWYQTVIRGDVNSIRIGKRTNIQDLCVVHVTNLDAPRPAGTSIGDDVTVGHRVILHGCTINDRCLIGMGAIVMDHAVIGEDCIIGAGALVTEGTKIPSGMLALGAPAKPIRPLTDAEKSMLPLSATHYRRLADEYLKQQS